MGKKNCVGEIIKKKKERKINDTEVTSLGDLGSGGWVGKEQREAEEFTFQD